MRSWLQALDQWDAELGDNKSLIKDFSCGDAEYPKPHVKVRKAAPIPKRQQEVAVDVVFLDGALVIHVFDK